MSLERQSELEQSRHELVVRLSVSTVLPLPIVTAAGFSAEASRSSAAIFSTLARISSVGSTQSIGIELQPSVGQLSRSSPLPRVPPAT